MVDIEQINNINRCATRISDETGKKLYGSGILFLACTVQYALIFTAAHVIDNIFLGNNSVKYRKIQISLNNCEDEIKSIMLDCNIKQNDRTDLEIGNICIHENYNKENFTNDVAIICVQREEWMNDLNTIQISKSNLQDKQIGYGFPMSSDTESTSDLENMLLGKSRLECKVNNSVDGRYVFDYDIQVHETDVTREQIMTGYSGTGLFSCKNHRWLLCGVVSSSFGKEVAGSKAYASNAELFFDIMTQHKITIELPKSFDQYRIAINEEFKIGFEDERDLFNYIAENLIKTKGLIPVNVFDDSFKNIKCNQDKRFCDEYWKGKLKKSVLLVALEKVKIENIKNPKIAMPKPYEDDIVNFKFLCTDNDLETVIIDLLNMNYFSNGQINDNTIFIWNNHSKNKHEINEYTRKRFRRVMFNIVSCKKDEYPSPREMADTLSGIISSNKGYLNFNIIEGNIKKCNLALLGTNRMMESIEDVCQGEYDDMLHKIKGKFDNQLKKIWEE